MSKLNSVTLSTLTWVYIDSALNSNLKNIQGEENARLRGVFGGIRSCVKGAVTPAIMPAKDGEPPTILDEMATVILLSFEWQLVLEVVVAWVQNDGVREAVRIALHNQLEQH